MLESPSSSSSGNCDLFSTPTPAFHQPDLASRLSLRNLWPTRATALTLHLTPHTCSSGATSLGSSRAATRTQPSTYADHAMDSCSCRGKKGREGAEVVVLTLWHTSLLSAFWWGGGEATTLLQCDLTSQMVVWWLPILAHHSSSTQQRSQSLSATGSGKSRCSLPLLRSTAQPPCFWCCCVPRGNDTSLPPCSRPPANELVQG
jgi:hypothetical protein